MNRDFILIAPSGPRPSRTPTLGCLLIALLLAGGGCHSAPQPADPPAATLREQPVHVLPLQGPLARPEAEISGLTWYEDWLILLPQFPREAFTATEGRLFAIARDRIEQALADSTAAPITPRPIPLSTVDLDAQTPTFQGFEAIAFAGNRMFLLVESTGDDAMRSYLLHGRMAPNLRSAHLDARTARPVPIVTTLRNMSAEALFVQHDTVVALHEANGANVNPRPRAHLFDQQLRAVGTQPFPTTEYRITDATAPDSTGRFWAINYFFPGERDILQPGPDSLAIRFGTGASHRRSAVVERLVAFQSTSDGIVRTDTPPITLRLASSGDGRNWEGLARWGDRGFLLATDRFPRTMLAFVPHPTVPSTDR